MHPLIYMEILRLDFKVNRDQLTINSPEKGENSGITTEEHSQEDS